MLALTPPYRIVEDVAVFDDDADPNLHYYLPLVPSVSVSWDAAARTNTPIAQCALARGIAGSAALAGGFLSLTVGLGVNAPVLDAIVAAVGARVEVDHPPLAPAPIVSGAATLVRIGGDGGDRPAVAMARTVVVAGAVHQATFAVPLDAAAAGELAAALEGRPSALGVVYSVTLTGTRPPLPATCTLDWSRVAAELGEWFGPYGVHTGDEVTAAIDGLVTRGVIALAADAGAPQGTVDRARAQLHDIVISALFTPTLGDSPSTVRYLFSGAGLKSVDPRLLDLDLRASRPVFRVIAAQATLTSLFAPLGASFAGRTMHLDLDDGSRGRRSASLMAVTFRDGHVASYEVRLRYGDNERTVSLTPAGAKADVGWDAIADGDQVRQSITWSYRVVYANPGPGQPPFVDVPQRETTDRVLVVEPA